MNLLQKTRPIVGDKYFTRKASGGYSSCIQGKPKDACDVLSNCVGFANGAFNKYCNFGYEKYDLNCNAENFIERAIARGLSVVKDPVVGGIMVWQKGATLSGNDGAGHVAFVTDKVNNDTVKTAESGYNSSPFWTATRKRGNGNWGQSSSYKYRGCIAPPVKIEEEKPKFTTGKYKLTVSKAIRTSHELTNNKVKVGKCMASVRPHLTSTNLNNDAFYRVGTVVDITEIYVDIENRVWGKLQNCWIVLCNKDGSPQANKE